VLNCPKQIKLLGGMFMGQYTEIMALISIIITMAALLAQNIIEDRQEKKEKEFREAEKDKGQSL